MFGCLYNAYICSHLMYGALIWGNPTLAITILGSIFMETKSSSKNFKVWLEQYQEELQRFIPKI